MVNEPPPKVVVTDLAAEGVRITANFRINSNENRPLEAYDEAASKVIESLTNAGFELYSPTMMFQTSGGKNTAADQTNGMKMRN